MKRRQIYQPETSIHLRMTQQYTVVVQLQRMIGVTHLVLVEAEAGAGAGDLDETEE